MGRRGNGEGSIYHREQRRTRQDGTVVVRTVWCASVSLNYGKRQMLYGRTRKEVADKLATALDAHGKGVPVPSQKQTLGRYLDEWLTNTVRPARRPGTYLRYEAATRLHIVPVIGKVKLAQIGPQHIQALHAALLDKKLGRSSIELVRATLSGALTQAVRWGFLVRNPLTLVKPPYTDDEDVPAPLLPEQAAAFLAAARGHDLEQLFTVMLASGLRLGEALGLPWSNLDLERGRLRVTQQLTEIPRQPKTLTPPKSKTGRRTIPLIPLAIAALEVQRLRLQSYSVRSARNLVFADKDGKPINSRHAERDFKKLLSSAGLPLTFTPHSLRHSTATYLMMMGVPIRVVMEIMGHSSISMTSKYQHVVDAALDDAAERLAHIFPVATPVATPAAETGA